MEEEEDAQLPTAFGQRLKEAADARRREADARARRDTALAGAAGASARVSSRSAPAPPAPGATFEAHTKGIGSKLLEKMGYKAGEGLGRNGTGIAEAIQTKLRPKGMGMGFNDYQEQPKTAAEAKAAEAAAAEPARGAGGAPAAPAQPKGFWKRRAKEQRQKRVYKTAEELLRESEAAAQAPGERMTVIDMRGAQARVVTNLGRLSEAPTSADEAAAAALIDATPMPELQHNLRLVVDLAEAEIQSLDRKLRTERDTRSILAREAARLSVEVDAHAERVSSTEALLEAVTAATAAASTLPPGAPGLAQLAARFRAVRDAHPDEWRAYGLANVALAQALPLVAAHLAGWQPLQSPAHGAAELALWRPLLESPLLGESLFEDAAAADDPYSRLFADTALLSLRSCVANAWEARQPEALLACLEAYAAALPTATRASLLSASVLPKLLAAVDSWEPRAEALPIHVWLHPWLPWLGESLAPLYAPIRHKLATALAAWHPSDPSALQLLAPWRTVFAAAEWEALVGRSILPKLAWALQQLAVNPAQQELQPLHWALAWAPVVPARSLASLLELHFFPRWHAVLHAWLAGQPNFDEVTRWYLGWKGLFPEEIMAHERVRRAFNVALDMMNAAVAGQLGPPPAAPAPMPAAAAPPPAPAPAAAEAEKGYGGGLSLRELVERYAEEQDLPFLPKPGRSHAGLQVYAFGRVSVVIDAAREALLARHAGGDWKPASIEQLVEMQQKGARA